MSPEAMVRATSDFDVMDALQDLAQHLADLPEQIDYRERRKRLATWHLPHDQWEALLAAGPDRPAGMRPSAEPQRHLRLHLARITSSEWTLAPALRVPAAEETWARRSGPAAEGMRCLTVGLSRQAVLLAEAADALARALSEPEQVGTSEARCPRKVQTAPPTAPNRTR